MNRLYFDTETTGFLSTDPELMPHTVQLAAVLVDPSFNEVASVNLIVKPDGWEVPIESSKVHGITTDKAHRFGVPKRVALACFSNLVKLADELVAHNLSYDYQVLSHEFSRFQTPNPMAGKKICCTMKAATNICKILKPSGRGYKWPNLQEAYKFFFDREFDNAHDALADVRACLAIHRTLLDK